jgi:hypothetical protein
MYCTAFALRVVQILFQAKPESRETLPNVNCNFVLNVKQGVRNPHFFTNGLGQYASNC